MEGVILGSDKRFSKHVFVTIAPVLETTALLAG